MYKRGQIYEYEVKPGDIRVALVVSADFRAKDDVLNVIILSDGYGSETCVGVGGYVADCCMVSFAWASKMGKYIGKANAEEMDCIDAEIMKCLGIERKEKPKAITPPRRDAHRRRRACESSDRGKSIPRALRPLAGRCGGRW